MVHTGSNQDVACTYPPLLFFTSIKASEKTATLLPFMDLGVPLLNIFFILHILQILRCSIYYVPQVLRLELVTYNTGDCDEVLSGLQCIQFTTIHNFSVTAPYYNIFVHIKTVLYLHKDPTSLLQCCIYCCLRIRCSHCSLIPRQVEACHEQIDT